MAKFLHLFCQSMAGKIWRKTNLRQLIINIGFLEGERSNKDLLEMSMGWPGTLRTIFADSNLLT
jgi:hypothetical protein